jgi:hypothetical protein
MATVSAFCIDDKVVINAVSTLLRGKTLGVVSGYPRLEDSRSGPVRHYVLNELDVAGNAVHDDVAIVRVREDAQAEVVTYPSSSRSTRIVVNLRETKSAAEVSAKPSLGSRLRHLMDSFEAPTREGLRPRCKAEGNEEMAQFLACTRFFDGARDGIIQAVELELLPAPYQLGGDKSSFNDAAIAIGVTAWKDKAEIENRDHRFYPLWLEFSEWAAANQLRASWMREGLQMSLPKVGVVTRPVWKLSVMPE